MDIYIYIFIEVMIIYFNFAWLADTVAASQAGGVASAGRPKSSLTALLGTPLQKESCYRISSPSEDVPPFYNVSFFLIL